MKPFKRILLYFSFLCISLLLAIYSYSFIHRLSLDEQRKNITIYDVNGSVMYESNFKKSMQWTSINKIPKFIQEAFVSVEDKRFFYHAGFDPIRISKALSTNIINGEVLQGGSTITQQYAKNLFLTNEQTLSRKAQEFFYATRLEMQYSKEDILEGYLNTIYFGHGIYGIQAAASYFFDQPLDKLTLAQIAMLIGIPNGPSIYSPFLHLDNAIKREHLILDILESNQVITAIEKKKAEQAPLTLAKNKNNEKAEISEYYIDAVIHELQKEKVDMKQAIQVYTYYDPAVQHKLNDAITKNVNMNNELEIAGIITQPFSGNIMALAGGKDYTISQYNRAIYSSRQVASTIKPLLYYTALQEGFTPASQFLSEKTKFKISESEEYAPTNYGDVYAQGNISMVNAISLSDNIYAVKTHLFLGIDTLHNALLDFGIRQSKATPSEALGSVNMSLLELSKIYNTFASEGLYIKPAFIKQINNPTKVIYKRELDSKRLLQRDETLILNQMLTSTFDIANKSYTFPSMYGHEPSIKVAAKSGTSDWDSLVMGFNPEYTIGIWSGFDDNRELKKEYYNMSKQIFKDTFNTLYEKRKEIWYQPSENILVKKINPISGNEQSDGSTYWFKK
ncbi:MAG: transglycosylase domain-containing protein [Longicatena sp.]